MVNTPLKWISHPKPVVISTVLHKGFADISNLTGASPPEKVNLTPYRKVNMSSLVKVRVFGIGLTSQDPYGGYTTISFGSAQVETPRVSDEEDKAISERYMSLTRILKLMSILM